MPIVAEKYQFVIGVDTHAASHSFAVIAPATTAVRAPRRIARRGVGRLGGYRLVWRRGGPGVHGSGYRVVEGGAQSVGDRRGTGKSDALDAVRIAGPSPAPRNCASPGPTAPVMRCESSLSRGR